MNEILENWISVRQASQEFEYTTEYIRRLIKEKVIVAERKGFSWLVSRQSLQAYKDKKTHVN